jgi:hypothetical protein
MLDEGKLRRKVFLRLLGSPIVLAPSLAGFTACTALWTLNWNPAFGWFAALAGVLGSAGAYVTRLVFDQGRTARTVLAEMQQDEQRNWQAALDDLDRRLVKADNDPRPELALRDLRALLRAFDDAAAQPQAADLSATVEVQSRVRQLFESSVKSLEQTLKLGQIAQQLQMPDARRPLLEQRERIVGDIQAGVRQLGSTLAALQRLDTAGAPSAELTRLREELDQSLELAEKVEARLHSLFDGALAEPQAGPSQLPAAEKVKGT